MGAESLGKAYILTHGVEFTDIALEHAEKVDAKRQNYVYNSPVNYSKLARKKASYGRPQELFLIGSDGYKVCSSAVSAVPGRENALVDYIDGKLVLSTPAMPEIGHSIANVEYVPQPAYYGKKTSSGKDIKRIVSACGYDEMNIWPWHDCAISKKCSFCGINSVKKGCAKNESDLLEAYTLKNEADPKKFWDTKKESVIAEIIEAMGIAIDDECYAQEIHLIMITGNLDDSQLNLQAEIYSDIAKEISSNFPQRFAEGIIAVTAPPSNLEYLEVMKNSGIEIGIFNLEAYGEKAFLKHCPGKSVAGRTHYLETLERGVEVFGWGKSWCNFVLGLEDYEELLKGCEILASKGIVPSANVLHVDFGSSLKIAPPTFEEVIDFYKKLSAIYKKYSMKPYYCAKALRTSVSNEAFAGRFDSMIISENHVS